MHTDDIRVAAHPAEVFVVSMNGTVLLLVDGSPTEQNRALVDEMRESFVVSGTPAADVEVIWQAARQH